MVASVESPFRLKCNGCSINRPGGSVAEALLKLANRHLAKFPHHTMTLWKGNTVVDTIDTRNASTLLTDETTKLNQDHQKILRDFIQGVDAQRKSG